MKFSYLLIFALSAQLISSNLRRTHTEANLQEISTKKILSYEERMRKCENLRKWIHAAKSGDLKTIKSLINEVGVDTPDEESPALGHSIAHNQTHIAKFLIENGADVNKRAVGTPLIQAARVQNIYLVKLLIEHGAITDQDNEHTALMEACSEGNIEIIKLLLTNGAKINAHNKKSQYNDSGFTPIMYAIKSKNPDVLKYLISAGANLNISLEGINDWTWTPISLAKKTNNNKIIEMLKTFLELQTIVDEITNNQNLQENYEIIKNIVNKKDPCNNNLNFDALLITVLKTINIDTDNLNEDQIKLLDAVAQRLAIDFFIYLRKRNLESLPEEISELILFDAFVQEKNIDTNLLKPKFLELFNKKLQEVAKKYYARKASK